MGRYGTSMNIDGIWGGNMFAGGSGSILPNKIISKHNFRYVPNMTGPDIVAKLRKHLDKHGFPDVEINIIGDVPWAKVGYDNDIARAVMTMFDTFGIELRAAGRGPGDDSRRLLAGVSVRGRSARISRSSVARRAPAAMRMRPTSSG